MLHRDVLHHRNATGHTVLFAQRHRSDAQPALRVTRINEIHRHGRVFAAQRASAGKFLDRDHLPLLVDTGPRLLLQ